MRAPAESLARREREMRLTAALDFEGEVGAFTGPRVSRDSTLGFTDGTGTVAGHRRCGLARAVKLESPGSRRAVVVTAAALGLGRGREQVSESPR